MLLQLCFISLLIIVGFAQEHLTCVRSDQTSRSGFKGSKGEPGISDNSILDELRSKSFYDYFINNFFDICNFVKK